MYRQPARIARPSGSTLLHGPRAPVGKLIGSIVVGFRASYMISYIEQSSVAGGMSRCLGRLEGALIQKV